MKTFFTKYWSIHNWRSLVLFLLFVLLLIGCAHYGRRIRLGNVEFFYTPVISAVEAENFGNHLVKRGLPTDKHIILQLDRVERVFELRYIILRGMQQDDRFLERLMVAVSTVPKELYPGAKIRVFVTDEDLKTIREMKI
ncbi:MAG: hypothetical protein HY707_07885 [Ignavibacteriae bacterium]|nr:hypothetical protein [Ignavibacteriota bacterium]